MPAFEILRSLRCRTCGYELRGLSAISRCPECGADAMGSLVLTVDPALQEFVRIRRPGRTAAALLGVVACMSLAVIVQTAGPAFAVLDEYYNRQGPLPDRVTALAWYAAAGLLALAAILTTQIAPSSEPLLRAEWGRTRVITMVGFLLWSGAILALPPGLGWPGMPAAPGPFVLIMTLVGELLAALLPLGGLRHLLPLLGRRSRLWREARHGRQGVDSLLAAASGVIVFSVAVPILESYKFDTLRSIAMTLAVASTAILVLGFIYIIANTLWIARSLIRPAAPVKDFIAEDRP